MHHLTRALLLGLAVAGATTRPAAQDARDASLAFLDSRRDAFAKVSQQIWDYAEVGIRRRAAPRCSRSS